MSDATSKPGPSTQFQPSQIGGPMPLPSVGGLGAASGARPSVIQLVFREKSALYAAYIPAFTDGGLFVPTTRDYK
ncbi:hypothetical protein ABTL29_19460, partial [Acinetobacter baumannii]